MLAVQMFQPGWRLAGEGCGEVSGFIGRLRVSEDWVGEVPGGGLWLIASMVAVASPAPTQRSCSAMSRIASSSAREPIGGTLATLLTKRRRARGANRANGEP